MRARRTVRWAARAAVAGLLAATAWLAAGSSASADGASWSAPPARTSPLTFGASWS